MSSKQHRCNRCGGTAHYHVSYKDDKPSEWLCGPHLDEFHESVSQAEDDQGIRTDGGRDMFDFPNEGEVELSPSFLCEACGYANVRLTTANGKPAAKCTNCGQGYLETDDPFITGGDR